MKNYYGYNFDSVDDASHFGIKGMKWAVQDFLHKAGF